MRVFCPSGDYISSEMDVRLGPSYVVLISQALLTQTQYWEPGRKQLLILRTSAWFAEV